MCKSIICALVPGLLWLTSCQHVHKKEKDEISFWNNAVIDSASRLLYKQKDTTAALRYFDSILHHSEAPTLYPKAARYLLKANYYYFFTPDNKSTAAMIDDALDVYQSGDLQNRYPRTYVKLLLFGGNIAYRLRQYSKANEYYFRAKKLGDAHLDPCERSAFSYSIGWSYTGSIISLIRSSTLKKRTHCRRPVHRKLVRLCCSSRKYKAISGSVFSS